MLKYIFLAFSDFLYFFAAASVKPKLNTRFQPQWSLKTLSTDPVQTDFKTLREPDRPDRPDRPKQMSLRYSQTNLGNIPDLPKSDSPKLDR